MPSKHLQSFDVQVLCIGHKAAHECYPQALNIKTRVWLVRRMDARGHTIIAEHAQQIMGVTFSAASVGKDILTPVRQHVGCKLSGKVRRNRLPVVSAVLPMLARVPERLNFPTALRACARARERS